MLGGSSEKTPRVERREVASNSSERDLVGAPRSPLGAELTVSPGRQPRRALRAGRGERKVRRSIGRDGEGQRERARRLLCRLRRLMIDHLAAGGIIALKNDLQRTEDLGEMRPGEWHGLHGAPV